MQFRHIKPGIGLTEAKSRQISNSRRLAARPGRVPAICGISGPVLFAIVVATAGSLQESYSHVSQSMSELGAVGASYAIVINTVGFPLLGLLMVAFAVGLDRNIGNGAGSKLGPALIILSGIALAITGIFRCDPGCEDVSAFGTTHSIFAVIAAFAMLFAPLFLVPRLRRDDRWRGYVPFSLATVAVALALSAVYGLFEGFKPLEGALQRASMGVSLLWVEVTAFKLLRLS